MESVEVRGLVVRNPILPASKHVADPLERKRAQGGLVRAAFGALLIIERVRPEGTRDGLCGPLDEGLTDEFAAGVAPMSPGFLAALLDYGGDAGGLLEPGLAGASDGAITSHAMPMAVSCQYSA